MGGEIPAYQSHRHRPRRGCCFTPPSNRSRRQYVSSHPSHRTLKKWKGEIGVDWKLLIGLVARPLPHASLQPLVVFFLAMILVFQAELYLWIRFLRSSFQKFMKNNHLLNHPMISPNVWMLIVGRLLLGFGIGCTNQSVPIYISEVAPYICRGGLHMFFQLSMAIGILIAYLLNYFVVDKIDGGWGWRLSLGLAIVPAIIVIMGASVLPETPISLIERGHNDIAKQQLIKLRGDVRGVSVTDVEQEFTRLVAASKESQTMKHPWKNIFKRKYRPQLVLAICIPMFQQLTGMNVIVFYAPVLLRTTIGLKLVIFLLIFIVIISTGTMIFLTDLFGRRKTFLMACFQMFTPQIVGIILLNLIIAAESEILIIHIVLYYYAVGLGFSWGPLGGLVPSEIFPLEVRSVGQSINVCVNMLFSFGVAQVFTPMFCRMKLELLIFFTCNVVGMYTFIYNYLPETSMVRIEYMIEVFKNHPSWRQYYHQVHHHGENRAGSRAPRKQN
ncbi:sugar transport protein 1-like isoform X4 [Euphorbia lathyris]|uniref:sugar transport protein 1-like isoform X4 n=1 Tax=Euphorbia lathyris TaxID=212925 RepID=UPI003313DE2E